MTKKELLSLLQEAESVLWAALGKDVIGAAETHRKIALALRAESADSRDGACASCGEPLIQPVTGRPRMYCGEACKKRAYRARAGQRGGA
jgi:hypothetical protein